VGLYTVLAAHRVGDTGTVVALEPNPVSFAALERNVAKRDLVRIVRTVQVAASDRDGTAELHIPRRDQAAWSSLGPPAVGTERTIPVETATLASLLGDLHPFLVKIDVEGWERHVIAGGGHLFASTAAPHLLFEPFDVRTGEALDRIGYGLYRYDARR